MDPKFQTSFIPKRPIVQAGMSMTTKKPTNVLSFVAIICILLAILLSAAVFFYQRVVLNSNEEKKQKIQAEIAAFEPELTRELSVVKARIDAATELLKNHVALSAFFALLEDTTLSTIQFKDFTYSSATDKAPSISMKGQARSFNDLIFQSDTMLANQYIKNPLFSDFSLDQVGNVQFSFTAQIDPEYISFTKTMERLSSFVPNTTPIESASATSSEESSVATTTTP